MCTLVVEVVDSVSEEYTLAVAIVVVVVVVESEELVLEA